MFAADVTLRDVGSPGETFLCRRLQNQNLPSTEKSGQIFIGAPEILQQCKALLSPYSSNMGKKVPKAVGDSNYRGFYAWEFRAMRTVSASTSPMSGSSVGPQSFVVVDVESCSGEAVKISADDIVAGKEVAARSFELQLYREE